MQWGEPNHWAGTIILCLLPKGNSRSKGTPKSIGFRRWNSCEAEIPLLQQLYDFSTHLYSREHDSFASQRFNPKAGTSIHTSRLSNML